jgi:uncharacterized protein (UPF0548 family)
LPLPAFFYATLPAVPTGSSAWGFTYPDVGATAGTPPAGWATDRQDRLIGRGALAWQKARAAVDRFVMFDLAWTRLLHTEGVRPGSDVLFAARVFGVWTLNACRIVYVIDEDGPEIARYGFAYGTLAAHAVAGEERFLATFDKGTGEVRFEVYKFSRPRHPVVRALGPVTWQLQRWFTQDCLARMAREVGDV